MGVLMSEWRRVLRSVEVTSVGSVLRGTEWGAVMFTSWRKVGPFLRLIYIYMYVQQYGRWWYVRLVLSTPDVLAEFGMGEVSRQSSSEAACMYEHLAPARLDCIRAFRRRPLARHNPRVGEGRRTTRCF